MCDLSPALAEIMADRHGLKRWYADFEAQLEAECPKMCHITTPARTHYPIARRCLEAGAHVIIEKPATTSLEQLEELVALAEAKGLALVEDQNYPFNAEVMKVLEAARRGELGEVAHVEVLLCLDILAEGNRYVDGSAPHPAVHEPGGAVSDFLTHLVSLAYPFVGPHERIQTLWRHDSTASIPFDEFRCFANCERGTAALVFSARSQPDGFWLRVYGTRAQAECSLWEPRVVTHRKYSGASALTPLRNALRETLQVGVRGPHSLYRKLSGGPGPYQGLWRLVRKTHEALATGQSLPLDHATVLGVSRWVHAILAEVPTT